MKVESIAECSLGAFCNTYDLHYVIIGLEKQQFLSFFEWPLKIHLSLMGDKELIFRPTHTGKTGSGKGKQNYF